MTPPERLALVVDDQLPARRLARVVLEEAGWEVIEVGSAAEAIQEAGARHPTLVILDHAMPGTTGTSVVGRLREQSPGVHVVLWTADDRARVSADETGADVCLDKVDFAALEALVSQWPAEGKVPR